MVGVAVLHILESYSNMTRDSCYPDNYLVNGCLRSELPLIKSMISRMIATVCDQFPLSSKVDTECDMADTLKW